MADVAEHSFTHKDVIRALLRQQNITEGFWQLTVRFGFAAANVGPNPDALNPAGIAQVESIGLRRVEQQADNLTLNAANLDLI
jgi:hypothetical protein